MLPVILTADLAVQAAAIGIEGTTLIVAIDVACEGIAHKPAKNDAAYDGAAIAVTNSPADQSASDGAEDRAGRGIALVTGAFIVTLAVVIAGSRRIVGTVLITTTVLVV